MMVKLIAIKLKGWGFYLVGSVKEVMREVSKVEN
jgi:hypothetical protein